MEAKQVWKFFSVIDSTGNKKKVKCNLCGPEVMPLGENEDLQDITDKLKETNRLAKWTYVTLDQKKLHPICTSVDWNTVDCLSASTIREACAQFVAKDGHSCLKVATDELHLIGDSLPAMGITLDVYLWPPKVAEKCDYIPFLGALRRLKDWHNANVTIFDKDPSPEMEFLQKFLSSAVCVNTNEFTLCADDSLLWRGKVSVSDKIENKGVTVPGVSLHQLTNSSSPDLKFPITSKKRANPEDEIDDGAELGRMLEVLDEVSLSSIQTMIKTPHVYKLCLYQKHSFSQVLMSYIQQSDHTGILARLAVYPKQKLPPTCADVGLSSDAWKENIMADIQYVQEPEEDLKDNFEFLYFVITSPYKDTTVDNFTAHAHLLHHPYHLDSSLVSSIYRQALVVNKADDFVVFNLNHLPLLNGETLRQIESDVGTVQRQMMENWKDEVTAEELTSFLTNIRLKYLSRLAEYLPKYKNNCHTLKINLDKQISELSDNTYNWSERLIQQYMESQKRSLSRIQSSESMPMSSPIQPCQTSTTVDIQSFLKFFHPCGSAVGDNLSPVRRRHPGRGQSKMILPDVSNTSLTSWPESKDVVSHDVYYNVDKKSEKVNNHMNRIQEKYVKEETYSSCQDPVVLFPKCVKRKKSIDKSELRRSPRKKAHRGKYDENVTVTLTEDKRQRKNKKSEETPGVSGHEHDDRHGYQEPCFEHQDHTTLGHLNESDAFCSEMDISSDSSDHSELSSSDSSDNSDTDCNNSTAAISSEHAISKAPLYVIQSSSGDIYTADISQDEHALAVAGYASRHNLSDTAIEHLVELVGLHIPKSNLLYRNVDKVKEKCGFDTNFMKYFTLCSVCKSVFEDKTDRCSTPNCTGRRLSKKAQSYFTTGNLELQLKEILMREGVFESIQESFEIEQPTTITDITNGAEYNKLREDGEFLSGKNNISLTMFTDGIPLFKSSGVSLWPVYLLINEIPRNDRFRKKNMELWGMWQGIGKPNMTLFLKPLVQDLHVMYSDGIQLNWKSEEIVCKAILLVATMDLQARSAVLHMTQHNGEYSCVYCMHPGKVVKSGKGHCRCFLYTDEPFVLRTAEEIYRDGKEAQREKKKVNGFTGESVLNYLPYFTLNNNIVVDYMHGMLLGITKKFLSLWFDAKSANQPYFIGNQIKEVDKIMKSITPPYLIKRLPRKLSNTMHHWKASELRAWLLFYSLPCLSGKLPNLYLKHFSTIVEATYILLGEGITEIDLRRSDLLLGSFLKTTDKLYGASVVGLNVHNLLHLCDCVRKWGPIWAWSCFSFESFNGEIKKSVHGTGNVCRQIFWSLQAQKRVENIATMPVGDHIKAFVSSIHEGKSDSNNTLSAHQCLVKKPMMIPENYEFADEIKTELVNLIQCDQPALFLKAKKIVRNGYIIYSKMCTKVKKRNSYTVTMTGNLEGGNLFEVQHFLVHKPSLHVFAVGKKLKTIGGALPANALHIQRVQYTRVRPNRLSDSLTPLSTIHERDSQRRFSTPQTLPSQTLGHATYGEANKSQDSSVRRRSDIGVNKTSTPVRRQLEHLQQADSNSTLSTSHSGSMKKESRSDRHKRRLQEIVDGVLNNNGVSRGDPIFKSCATRLFKVTKLFVMDLPTSRNLKDEMRKIAESQVKQVIEVDQKRLRNIHDGRNKNKWM